MMKYLKYLLSSGAIVSMARKREGKGGISLTRLALLGYMTIFCENEEKSKFSLKGSTHDTTSP
jgi:hypothetical protein